MPKTTNAKTRNIPIKNKTVKIILIIFVTIQIRPSRTLNALLNAIIIPYIPLDADHKVNTTPMVIIVLLFLLFKTSLIILKR